MPFEIECVLDILCVEGTEYYTDYFTIIMMGVVSRCVYQSCYIDYDIYWKTTTLFLLTATRSSGSHSQKTSRDNTLDMTVSKKKDESDMQNITTVNGESRNSLALPNTVRKC